MADFSKQWCEINDPEMPHDFDILEEHSKLKPGHYVPYICEGFGFSAIAKMDDEDETCMLLMPHYDSTGMTSGVWKSYNEIIK